MRTIAYIIVATVILTTGFFLGFVYASLSYLNGDGEMASFQQPRNITDYSGTLPVDIPEVYMQMSVDKMHPDTLIGWFDVDADTLHLRFIVLNNLQAMLDSTIVDTCEEKEPDYDSIRRAIGAGDSLCAPSP